jgi:hypothetical protein
MWSEMSAYTRAHKASRVDAETLLTCCNGLKEINSIATKYAVRGLDWEMIFDIGSAGEIGHFADEEWCESSSVMMYNIVVTHVCDEHTMGRDHFTDIVLMEEDDENN